MAKNAENPKTIAEVRKKFVEKNIMEWTANELLAAIIAIRESHPAVMTITESRVNGELRRRTLDLLNENHDGLSLWEMMGRLGMYRTPAHIQAMSQWLTKLDSIAMSASQPLFYRLKTLPR